MIAGEDWHRGVIGIVASRLVERFRPPGRAHRGGEPGEEWTGSGRSIPRFDLHGALGACSSHLSRWGGHRAAAGLSIRPENVDAFARGVRRARGGGAGRGGPAAGDHRGRRRPGQRAHARAVRGARAPGAVRPREPGRHAAGRRLRALGARGRRGREAPAARRHRERERARARSPSGAARRSTAYRRPGRYDVAFKLAANRWNGTVAPQLVVREIFDTPARYEELRLALAGRVEGGAGRLDARGAEIFAELGLDRRRHRMAAARRVRRRSSQRSTRSPPPPRPSRRGTRS